MGRNQYWAGRVYDLYVYYMTGTPEGSNIGITFIFTVADPEGVQGVLLSSLSAPVF